jgi:hypothetical protein
MSKKKKRKEVTVRNRDNVHSPDLVVEFFKKHPGAAHQIPSH